MAAHRPAIAALDRATAIKHRLRSRKIKDLGNCIDSEDRPEMAAGGAGGTGMGPVGSQGHTEMLRGPEKALPWSVLVTQLLALGVLSWFYWIGEGNLLWVVMAACGVGFTVGALDELRYQRRRRDA